MVTDLGATSQKKFWEPNATNIKNRTGNQVHNSHWSPFLPGGVGRELRGMAWFWTWSSLHREAPMGQVRQPL